MDYQDKNLFQAPKKDLFTFLWKLATFSFGFYMLLDYIFVCRIKTYQGFYITIFVLLIILLLFIGKFRKSS